MAKGNEETMEDNNSNENDDVFVQDDDDETPAFVNLNEAVEVQVDEDAPMDEDDDDDDNGTAAEGNAEQEDSIVDMSKFKLESHQGPVYGVSCHFDAASQKLTVITGAGDDRAFLHHVAVPSTTTTATSVSIALDHAHTDSVSTVALNLHYVSEDLVKTPRMAAVGAYDGGTSETRNESRIDCLSDFMLAVSHDIFIDDILLLLQRFCFTTLIPAPNCIRLKAQRMWNGRPFTPREGPFSWSVRLQIIQYGCFIFPRKSACRCL